MKKQVWVSPMKNGGWKVHRPGAKRDIIHTDKKSDAIKRATKIAKKNKTELLSQKRNGRINLRNSYGRDPFPPRG